VAKRDERTQERDVRASKRSKRTQGRRIHLYKIDGTNPVSASSRTGHDERTQAWSCVSAPRSEWTEPLQNVRAGIESEGVINKTAEGLVGQALTPKAAIFAVNRSPKYAPVVLAETGQIVRRPTSRVLFLILTLDVVYGTKSTADSLWHGPCV
jgi:hypothetical protein